MKQNKPSQTAKGVALVSLCLSVDPENPDLVSEQYANLLARLMLASEEMSNLGIRFYRSRVGLWLLRRVFDKTMPGQLVQFGYRKAYFEAQARAAIAAGARQILVLGAGYDLLCLRLAPEFSNIKFFEIDHPATAAAKRRGLEAIGMPKNLLQISADLTERPLADVLNSQNAWDESRCSFVIAEGLTQYLAEDLVRELFETVDAMTGLASRLGFTFVGWREQEGRVEAGQFTEKVLADFEKRGEPWLWGFPAEKIGRFFEGTPWSLIEAIEPAGIEYFACVEKL